MGGIDPRKLVSFRATEGELAEIERLVKASGLSKQEYLLSCALGTRSHTHILNADSSIKGSHSKKPTLLSAPKFVRGQEITAQSAKIYSQLIRGSYQETSRGKYLLSTELNLICQVKAGKKSRAGKNKLEVVAYYPDDEVVFFDDGNFLRSNGEQIEWFTKKELADVELAKVAAIAEATAAIEPPNEEISH